MKTKTRSKNVVLNSIVGIGSVVVSTIVTFVVRKLLSATLGDEIYGLNSLFSNVINTLLIMELGISSAIVIHLYKPIAEDNREKIKSIVRLYRNIYRVFSLVIVAIGLIIDLFLIQYVVTSDIPLWDIRLYFLIFLLSITLKYLWSYKRCLLLSSQNNRISTGVTALVECVFGICEIFVILKTKNYYLYLTLLVIQNSLSNGICNLIINKKFSYIKEKNVAQVTYEDKKTIIKTLKPLCVQRISGVVQDSFGSIVLSFFSDTIAAVGFYGNYQLVIHTVQTLFSQIGASFTSSFGNYSIGKNNEELFSVYKKSRLFMNIIAGSISICFMVLIQKFIELFFGASVVLSNTIVILCTIYTFMCLNNVCLNSVQNSLGIHKLDAPQMALQAVLNIILSILGGYFLGLEGILLGTILSVFVFSTIFKGAVIYKHIFIKSFWNYLIDILIEILKFVVCSVPLIILAYLLASKVTYLCWIIQGFSSAFIAILLYVLLSLIDKKERIYIVQVFLSFLKRKKK